MRDGTPAWLMACHAGFPADESHREQTSERVHEAHTRLAKAGRVVGGRVFGYRNVNIYNGEDSQGRPLKSHVERVIEPTEAAVVKRIFAQYDSGEGLKRIAKRLAAEGAACPKPFMRKDGLQPVAGWSPSTIRTILSREIYRGVIVWNKSRKRPITWGQVKQQPRPESEWMRADAPHLRIIDEALWLRVAARRKETEGRAVRFESGLLSGRPPKSATQNVLAGMAKCAVCGGGLVVETSPTTRGRIPEYVCGRHRRNGTCSNALYVSAERMNEAVLQAIEEHALTPEAIEQVIHLSERDDVADMQARLEKESKDVAKRIARLVCAIEGGADADSLVAKLRELEARQKAIREETANLRPVPRLAPAVIENRLSGWRRLLRQSPTQARTVLQRVLRGRITFTPRADGSGYDFEALTRYDKLFTGITLGPPPAFIDVNDTTGKDDISPDETFDRDYGALLDRAYVKGMASPPGTDNAYTVPLSTRAACEQRGA